MTAARQLFYDKDYYTEYGGYVSCAGIPTYKLDSVKRFAGRLHSLTKPLTVLDCGCAAGALVHGFLLLGIDALGIDISEFAIQHSFPEVRERLMIGDISDQLPWPNCSFDLVTGFDVLEHQQDYATLVKCVSEMCRVSRQAIFLRMPMVKYNLVGSVQDCHDFVKSLNPLPHRVRLELIDIHPYISRTQPALERSIEHPNEHPRDFWVSLFANFGFHERALPEEYYVFPNILVVHSFNTLFFVKDEYMVSDN